MYQMSCAKIESQPESLTAASTSEPTFLSDSWYWFHSSQAEEERQRSVMEGVMRDGLEVGGKWQSCQFRALRRRQPV